MEAPQPKEIAPSITLRPYQKQSLAFMLSIEESTDSSLLGIREVVLEPASGSKKKCVETVPSPARGGWLCDEVGMGDAAWLN